MVCLTIYLNINYYSKMSIEFFRDNNSGTAPKDFWKARHLWEPTWNRSTNSSHMMIDYVRVWAL
jgi:hypothetical protein